MIHRDTFDRIITMLFDGYGRQIKGGQLDVMYSRLNHVHEEALRAAARKWIDNESKPPSIADINRMIGGGKNAGQDKTEICPECGSEVPHLYSIGHAEYQKNVCAECWHGHAFKAGALQTWEYRKHENTSQKAV